MKLWLFTGEKWIEDDFSQFTKVLSHFRNLDGKKTILRKIFDCHNELYM